MWHLEGKKVSEMLVKRPDRDSRECTGRPYFRTDQGDEGRKSRFGLCVCREGLSRRPHFKRIFYLVSHGEWS